MAELGALRFAVYVTAASGGSSHREIKLYFWHTNKISIHCKGAINFKCNTDVQCGIPLPNKTYLFQGRCSAAEVH